MPSLAKLRSSGGPHVPAGVPPPAPPSTGLANLVADHDLVAPGPEGLGQPGLALEVGVGGIEEVDAGFQGGVHHRWDGVPLHEEAEIVGAEADDGYLE